jgi:DNA polymerase V
MPGKQSPFEFYPLATDTKPLVRMAEAPVHAGFPIPVDDAYMQQPIDLNVELIKHPAASYMVRVVGDSMIDEGVEEGDLLVVDREMYPTEQNLTICMYNGEFALKRIVQQDGKLFLMSGNKKYKPIEVSNPNELSIFGVVTWVMKKKA